MGKHVTVMNAEKGVSAIPQEFAELNLSMKEYFFVATYCSNGFDHNAAAKLAGYGTQRKIRNGHGDAFSASYLLHREKIIKAIKLFIDAIINPIKAKLEYEILDAYYKRATYRVSDFIDNQGNVKPLSQVPKEWLCCIDGVEKRFFGKDANRSVVTYSLPNRDTALQMLYKFVTGFDPNTVDIPDAVNEKLKNIFSKAFNADSDFEIRGTKTTTTLEQEISIQRKGTKGGQPAKNPAIEVHKVIKK
jgi:hypothetical protein